MLTFDTSPSMLSLNDKYCQVSAFTIICNFHHVFLVRINTLHELWIWYFWSGWYSCVMRFMRSHLSCASCYWFIKPCSLIFFQVAGEGNKWTVLYWLAGTVEHCTVLAGWHCGAFMCYICQLWLFIETTRLVTLTTCQMLIRFLQFVARWNHLHSAAFYVPAIMMAFLHSSCDSTLYSIS